MEIAMSGGGNPNHDPKSGEFTSGPGGPGGAHEHANQANALAGYTVKHADLRQQGVKPKLRSSGTDINAAAQVAFGTAVRDKAMARAYPTAYGWKIAAPGAKMPTGHPYLEVTPEGKLSYYHNYKLG